MAAFIAMTSWRGEFTDEYFAQPPADPAALGMPAEDDGSRDDPLLSDRSWAVSSYHLDVDALAAAPTRVVIAVGEESEDTFTGRTSLATAELLGQQPTVFPSHHGGFARRRVRIPRPARSLRAQAARSTRDLANTRQRRDSVPTYLSETYVRLGTQARTCVRNQTHGSGSDTQVRERVECRSVM